MALNVKGLKKADKALNSGGGNDLFLTQKNIGEETFIRILPPLPELNGYYFMEYRGYWINKKFYISDDTFNKRCVIEERIDEMKKEAKAEKDDELLKLAEDLSQTTQFYIPVLHLELKADADGDIDDFSVIGEKPKVLQCGRMLMKAINKIVISPKMARKLKKVDDGITDRVEGFNIVLSKTGEGLKTEYSAYEDEQMEMDASYYEKIPSILKLIKSSIYSDEYLEKVLDNYFDGDPMPEDKEKVSKYKDELDGDSDSSEEETKKPSRRSRRSKETREDAKEVEVNDAEEVAAEEKPKRRSRRKVEEPAEEVKEEKEEAPKEESPKRRSRRKSTEDKPAEEVKETKSEKPTSSLMDELEDLDD